MKTFMTFVIVIFVVLGMLLALPYVIPHDVEIKFKILSRRGSPSSARQNPYSIDIEWGSQGFSLVHTVDAAPMEMADGAPQARMEQSAKVAVAQLSDEPTPSLIGDLERRLDALLAFGDESAGGRNPSANDPAVGWKAEQEASDLAGPDKDVAQVTAEDNAPKLQQLVKAEKSPSNSDAAEGAQVFYFGDKKYIFGPSEDNRDPNRRLRIVPMEGGEEDKSVSAPASAAADDKASESRQDMGSAPVRSEPHGVTIADDTSFPEIRHPRQPEAAAPPEDLESPFVTIPSSPKSYQQQQAFPIEIEGIFTPEESSPQPMAPPNSGVPSATVSPGPAESTAYPSRISTEPSAYSPTELSQNFMDKINPPSTSQDQFDEQYEEYTVGPDDVLEIKVIQPEEIMSTVTVSPDGFITFPYIGGVPVKNMTLTQIQDNIVRRLSNGYMKYPVVFVSLTESRSRKFFVYGEVKKPGTYQLDPNTTVLRAISVAGGFTKFGSGSRIKLLRPREEGPGYDTIRVNIKKVMAGDPEADLALLNGDIVVVSEGMF